MLLTILTVVQVLSTISVVVLVLLQRGKGADAGAGFGAGASGTVFGARGASNFLSKSTKWLAIVFFGISLFMAWQASHSARPAAQQNLGIMAEQPAAPAAGELSKPAQQLPSMVPSAPIVAPGATPSSVPSAPASSVPVESVPVQAPAAKETAPSTPAQAPAIRQPNRCCLSRGLAIDSLVLRR